ncbi:MAG: hypothetical protein IIC73_05755 [Armatimonadetes bacterium]|nr:hypothetical protein [Armatimonadota bacterium]
MRVIGIDLDGEHRCRHWNSEFDVVAVMFKCCGEFYACRECHDELADHEVRLWEQAEHDTRAVACGTCRQTVSIRDYLRSNDRCPACGRAFNPGCRKHHHLYFMPQDAQAADDEFHGTTS